MSYHYALLNSSCRSFLVFIQFHRYSLEMGKPFSTVKNCVFIPIFLEAKSKRMTLFRKTRIDLIFNGIVNFSKYLSQLILPPESLLSLCLSYLLNFSSFLLFYPLLFLSLSVNLISLFLFLSACLSVCLSFFLLTVNALSL